MSPRALIALGVGQCVNWGVLYYAFAVLLLPVQHDLAVAQWVVTGAFSLALLVSAACAPAIGHWADRGHAGRAIEWGGLAAAALLVVWPLWPTVWMLYLVWPLLGVCMSATLYEPAFALIGQSHGDTRQRLRALGAITVFGGMASTIFLPATAWLVAVLGWRQAVVVLAVVVATSTIATRVFTLTTSAKMVARPSIAAEPPTTHVRTPHIGLVVLAFSLASLGSAALMSNIVPALGERAVSPALAATLGGLLGIMQIPGRALVMHGAVSASPSTLVVLSLCLQALGLGALAAAPSVVLIAAGIAVFAVGAGLATIARPHLIQTMFGPASAGAVNGRLARAQQLARAAGPILVTGIAATSSYALAFAVLGSLFVLLSFAWVAAGRQSS